MQSVEEHQESQARTQCVAMAKKKSNRSHGQRWREAEEVTLLAWLDYTLRHPQVNFQHTLLGRLDDRYTLEKVERKLSWFWREFGPKDVPAGTKGIDFVYAHGSKSIEGLSELEKDQIADALDHFERYFATAQETATPQVNRLRSASRFDSNAPISQARVRTRSAMEMKNASDSLDRFQSYHQTLRKGQATLEGVFQQDGQAVEKGKQHAPQIVSAHSNESCA